MLGKRSVLIHTCYCTSAVSPSRRCTLFKLWDAMDATSKNVSSYAPDRISIASASCSQSPAHLQRTSTDKSRCPLNGTSLCVTEVETVDVNHEQGDILRQSWNSIIRYVRRRPRFTPLSVGGIVRADRPRENQHLQRHAEVP
jgi:hypothetical protein